MKLEQKTLGDDLELDMSPMIDMVFLLLIFFIVASQVIDEKPKVGIPAAAFAKVPEDTTGRLMVTVTKDGKFFVGQIPVTLEQLKEQLGIAIEADENLRILIRSDGETRYKINEKVMIACAEVGATDLIYSAFEE
ncbi:ExbD/TolR family protein [Pontiella sulfatireligans]|uniref:Biopolymer transport protein ExbD n=1 Tax=Pontiella sulfatireligans TaxID=2750658 RepID=A0A6C2UQT8_9BACT|nr:biopolymer transporter ExbD [Pontiella sulfatireligans]VGO22660.1 Biopolymer transport protein ExbD [Pontiella sulfatireligans]